MYVRFIPIIETNDPLIFSVIDFSRLKCVSQMVKPGEFMMSTGGIVSGAFDGGDEAVGVGIGSNHGSRAIARCTGSFSYALSGTDVCRRCSCRQQTYISSKYAQLFRLRTSDPSSPPC